MLGIWHEGDNMKEIFGSALSMVVLLCALYGCSILVNFVFYMLVMNIFYDSDDVWISSCFE